jgi:hypothetical protein
VPGLVLHQGATIQCPHNGRATPPTTYPRVLVSNMPIAVETVPYVVAGCILPPPPNGNGPCVTANWVTGSLRVRAGGALPVLVFGSQSVTVTSGTPLLSVTAQTRVVAT